jgi:hypothetical protein
VCRRAKAIVKNLEDMIYFVILLAIIMTPRSIAKLRPVIQRADLFAGD